MTTRRVQTLEGEQPRDSTADARSDEELMSRFVHGDEAGFVELHRRYAPMLVRFLRRMIGDTEPPRG